MVTVGVYLNAPPDRPKLVEFFAEPGQDGEILRAIAEYLEGHPQYRIVAVNVNLVDPKFAPIPKPTVLFSVFFEDRALSP